MFEFFYYFQFLLFLDKYSCHPSQQAEFELYVFAFITWFLSASISKFPLSCKNFLNWFGHSIPFAFLILSVNSFDVLIHTAITGGRRTKSENGDVIYNNLLMFENLVKFAHHFKLIINLDSGAIYDRATNIFCRKEDDIVSVPNDYYGFSKYLIYNRSLQYSNIINLRIFNLFHT